MKTISTRGITLIVVLDILFTLFFATEFFQSEDYTQGLIGKGANIIQSQANDLDSSDASSIPTKEAWALSNQMLSTGHAHLNKMASIGLLVAEKYIFLAIFGWALLHRRERVRTTPSSL